MSFRNTKKKKKVKKEKKRSTRNSIHSGSAPAYFYKLEKNELQATLFKTDNKFTAAFKTMRENFLTLKKLTQNTDQEQLKLIEILQCV